MSYSKGPSLYTCRKCGWSGMVNGRRRCLPCCAKAVERWRKRYPEKYSDLCRRMEKKLRTERPEVAAKYKRIKRSRRPEHYKAKWQERVAWLKSGDVTREQLKSIYESANGRCQYCGTEVSKPRLYPFDPRGFDHVIPRARGGLHTASNIVVACRVCNSRKSASEVKRTINE